MRSHRVVWLALALAIEIAAGGLVFAAGGESVREMLRRVLTPAESVAKVTLERSDPFGGPRTRERGRVWFLPGRGLRYRSVERGGQDVVIDRAKDAFLVYNPQERVLYRGAYGRAPARLRRLIAEPERALTGDLRPVAERRAAGGTLRDGFRIGGRSLGDSARDVTLWIAGDARTGLPRWVSLASETDTLWVEFREWKLQKAPRADDLATGAPKGTREEPLDPRELLERSGPGAKRESR